MNRPRVRLGDLSVGFIQPLSETLQQRGIDPSPLLARYG
ncbi:AraC family transcriptional regulator, partial [Pseudomonas frederiksbergensis]|nr:AraC family transcriptional regulator [Pseudomonas frederiksbergensis]